MSSESSKRKELPIREKRRLARTDRPPHTVLQQHSFLTDPNEVKKMEKDLLDLMSDFNEGKLHAFGNACTLEKMDQVRESQESLAQLHFELDVDDTHRKEHEEVGRNRNLERLMKDLEKLSSSIKIQVSLVKYYMKPEKTPTEIAQDDGAFDQTKPSS